MRMWLLLRRRDAGRSDPQRLTSVLAVVAFAVTTAVALLVLGGFQAFAARAASATRGSTCCSRVRRQGSCSSRW
jgi:hypothetical protein